MAQLSLYMDDAQMDELRADAEREGLSISAYARKVLEKRNDPRKGWVNGWPPNYWESMQPIDIELPEELPLDPVEPLNLV